MRRATCLVVALVLSAVVFNLFPEAIDNLNARVRVLVTTGAGERLSFAADGLPMLHSPRVGAYQSPFYVVFFGLQYSSACAPPSSGRIPFHWLPDPSTRFWPHSPLPNTTARFRAAADWVVDHVEYAKGGHAHLLYHFDWPYARYPGGVVRAPWWSGLADAQALTLLLRANDCFGGSRYLKAAGSLYASVSASVDSGGSRSEYRGLPWIEEYVDPRVPASEMSKVLNGMIYSYFGVRGYEEFTGHGTLADSLALAIAQNVPSYDRGLWSSYDGVGDPTNIKYHEVTLALLQDPRIHRGAFDGIIRRWRWGRVFLVPVYFILGPRTIGVAHFFVTYLLLVGLIAYLCERVTVRLAPNTGRAPAKREG